VQFFPAKRHNLIVTEFANEDDTDSESEEED
jgi:hypothetical protein